MKWMLMVVAALVLAGLLVFIAKAIQSHKPPERLGLQNGMLLPCPDSPNCVCSEGLSQASEQHAIAPIQANEGAWDSLKKRIIEQGGVILKDDGVYLHATFTSALFRYVDDVELRRDQKQGLIHIRSASRVGHSDFGVNRERVERLTP